MTAVLAIVAFVSVIGALWCAIVGYIEEDIRRSRL